MIYYVDDSLCSALYILIRACLYNGPITPAPVLTCSVLCMLPCVIIVGVCNSCHRITYGIDT